MQQSSMSAHGSSTNDVSYNIDGATVNWPGGGGGATMIYYDQGMFEEVNSHDLGDPGGSAGRRRLDQHGHQGRRQQVEGQRSATTSPTTACRRRTTSRGRAAAGRPTRSSATRPRRPTTSTSPAAARSSRTGCGSTAPIRKWVVNKLVNATEPRRQPGARRQRPEELLGQGGRVDSRRTTSSRRSYLWNNKIRGHRRDDADAIMPDIASLVQTNPVQTTPGEVHRHPEPRWCSSRTSA